MYKANTEVVICLCVNQEKKDKNENCKLLWMIRNSETLLSMKIVAAEFVIHLSE